MNPGHDIYDPLAMWIAAAVIGSALIGFAAALAWWVG
jgi:hypothetical protein